MLSDGRFELGLGSRLAARGIRPGRHPVRRAGTRIERLAESVTIIKGLLAGERVTLTGRHYAIAGLAGRPIRGPATATAHPDRRRRPAHAHPGRTRGRHRRARAARAPRRRRARVGRLRRGRAAGEARVGARGGRGPLRRARAQHPDPGGGRHGRRRRRPINSRRGSLSTPELVLGMPVRAGGNGRRRSARRCGSGESDTGSRIFTMFDRDAEAFAPVVAKLAGT